MEVYSQPMANTQERRRQLVILLNIATVLLFAVSAVLILLTLAGYGTVHFEGVPADATVRLNGHAVTSSVLKLRTGSYQVLIASPFSLPYEGVLNVGLLRTVAYKPAIKQRSADAIASSVIGAVPGTSEPPQFAQTHWFESNTWIAGELTPSEKVFVFHYDTTEKKWTVAYSTASGYPNSITNLPAEIAMYVRPMSEGGAR